MLSCDIEEWVQALGVRHQNEVHKFLAKVLISFLMSCSCNYYQSIEERNYNSCSTSETINLQCNTVSLRADFTIADEFEAKREK